VLRYRSRVGSKVCDALDDGLKVLGLERFSYHQIVVLRRR